MAINPRIIGDELAGGRTATVPPLQQTQPFGFNAGQREQGELAAPGGGIDAFMAQFNTQNGVAGLSNGIAESNFNLNKSVGLRSLALQRQELQRQQSSGLRDIEQSRVEGLRAAVNNALQRGIFRSGIREQNEARVERESGEAAGDLKGRIRIALAQIANQRRGVAGRQFDDGSGGPGGAASMSPEDVRALFERLRGLAG